MKKQPDFRTIPVGVEGKYAIQRTHEGEVRFLSTASSEEVGSWSLGFAEATCKILDGAGDTGLMLAGYKWVPWHTDHLNTKRPLSMFPPGRRVLSPFDTLGRA